MLPDLGWSMRIQADHTAFSQSVPFDQRQADRGIKPGQVFPERRSAGANNPQPASQARVYLRKYELVRDLERSLHPPGNGLAFFAQPADFRAQAHRAVEQLPRDRALLLDLSVNARKNPLPDAGRSEKKCRPDGFHLARQLGEALGKPDGNAQTDGQQLDHYTLRDVRRWKEADGAVRGQ